MKQKIKKYEVYVTRTILGVTEEMSFTIESTSPGRAMDKLFQDLEDEEACGSFLPVKVMLDGKRLTDWRKVEKPQAELAKTMLEESQVIRGVINYLEQTYLYLEGRRVVLFPEFPGMTHTDQCGNNIDLNHKDADTMVITFDSYIDILESAIGMMKTFEINSKRDEARGSDTNDIANEGMK